jgi:predicted nuclease of predicted toxin-antitoxin system
MKFLADMGVALRIVK